MVERLRVKVAHVTDEADDIKSFEFVAADGAGLPPFTAGAHVDVFLPSGLIRQYSLANDPRERDRYVVAVLREVAGRGGSAEMHSVVVPGTALTITEPQNTFPLSPEADHHVLIAGGIGITPILAMVRDLEARGADYTLHYCTRTPAKTAFLAELQAPPFGAHVRFHHDNGNPAEGLDVQTLLAERGRGHHVYCCGPAGLMAAVKGASAHWPTGTVHFEYFTVDETAEAAAPEPAGFEIEIESTGLVLQVPADKTIIEVLREAGIEIETMCEEGICGTCITEVTAGEPDHRDMVLSDDEKAAGKLMTVCCSRARSQRLTLKL